MDPASVTAAAGLRVRASGPAGRASGSRPSAAPEQPRATGCVDRHVRGGRGARRGCGRVAHVTPWDDRGRRNGTTARCACGGLVRDSFCSAVGGTAVDGLVVNARIRRSVGDGPAGHRRDADDRTALGPSTRIRHRGAVRRVYSRGESNEPRGVGFERPGRREERRCDGELHVGFARESDDRRCGSRLHAAPRCSQAPRTARRHGRQHLARRATHDDPRAAPRAGDERPR